jgi:hypothetical protein
MMTRKDYIVVAQTLLETKLIAMNDPLGYTAGGLLRFAAESLAAHMKNDNPSFDRERFLNSAGIPPNRIL